MDKAWTKVTANAFKIRTVKEQRIHKGLALLSGPRMNHKAGRFVQNDHIPVFVQNRKRDRLGPAYDGLWGRDLSPDNITRLG
jgi:hypothetical protein